MLKTPENTPMIRAENSYITPELIELEYVPASLSARAFAFFIDLTLYTAIALISSSILLTILILLLAYVFSSLGADSNFFASLNSVIIYIGLALLYIFFITWLLPVLIEVKTKGSSLGKSIVGIRVLKDDGTPIGWREAILRRSSLMAELMPMGNLLIPAFLSISVFSILLHPKGKRLGDLIAGTAVYNNPYHKNRNNLLLAHVVPNAPPIVPLTPLHPKMQLSIIQFAQHAHRFSPEYTEHLLKMIPDIAYNPQSPDEPQGAKRLIGIANHLMGRGAKE